MKNILREYKVEGDGVQAPGAIVLVERTSVDISHPYVTWFRNDQTGEFSSGRYFAKDEYDLALADFYERAKRYGLKMIFRPTSPKSHLVRNGSPS